MGTETETFIPPIVAPKTVAQSKTTPTPMVVNPAPAPSTINTPISEDYYPDPDSDDKIIKIPKIKNVVTENPIDYDFENSVYEDPDVEEKIKTKITTKTINQPETENPGEKPIYDDPERKPKIKITTTQKPKIVVTTKKTTTLPPKILTKTTTEDKLHDPIVIKIDYLENNQPETEATTKSPIKLPDNSFFGSFWVIVGIVFCCFV